MLAQIIKIEELSTRLVNYYTIQFEGKALAEFADFNRRLSADKKNEEELNEIFHTLDTIGRRGALRMYFNREEDDAFALPPKNDSYVIAPGDFGIRLYCLVLNQSIVFLLNGDRKKTQKALEKGSNVSQFFRQANCLHRELIKDRISKEISWNGFDKNLIYEKDYLVDVKG